ncbi:MAG TPA: DUF1707 and DUF4870 domain-containing protein [Propionibacteriaceae bacterium]|nr:DUF1707 and DUF4870 domain-containing protein [Propionibacteriaceae bacterium]
MSQYPNPNNLPVSLSTLVTEAQRDRAEHYLQEAFADGRLTSAEFDHRIGLAIQARTRRDLNLSLQGLVHVPIATAAIGHHPAYLPVFDQSSAGTTGRTMAGLTHLSGLASSMVGPGIVYAVSAEGSHVRREAAKAFNAQVAWAIVLTLAGIIIGDMWLGAIVLPVLWLVWAITTVLSGVRAMSGQPSDPMISRWLPIKLLRGEPRVPSIRR